MRNTIVNLTVVAALILGAFGGAPVARADDTPTPESVGLPGTHQNELGCPGEWQPACELTWLVYDVEDDVWQAEFEILPANDDDKKGPRYKVALNGGWSENYGVNAARNGPDIPLVVPEPTRVKFYYSHKTHWIADNFNKPIFVATGDFQRQLGCAQNDDAACLRAWLQDPDGDGVYGFATRALKAGTYTFQLTAGEDAAQTVGEAQSFTVDKSNDEIYFAYDMAKQAVTISTTGAPVGNLTKLRAHWVTKDTLLWKVFASPNFSYALYYSPEAALELTPQGIQNGLEIPLTYVQAGPDIELQRKHPYLNQFAAFKIGAADLDQVGEALRGQLAIVARDVGGRVVDAAGVQIPGALDDLYDYTGPLGATFDAGAPTLRVWAPTAKAVTLHLYDTSTAAYAQKLPMTLDLATGVWAIAGQADWRGKFYLYEVQVFVPATGKIEKNLVTDPYSFSLSTNSRRSQIVDLTDPALMPAGWEALEKPALAAPEDIVLYELHIRDFSLSDESVPAELRGTYGAFTVKDSNGMRHLAALAEAGLTHLHLLPTFDIASVDEDKSKWQTADMAALAALPPDSDQQAAAVELIKGTDGFNWGYDPLHYTVPEGSYAVNPDGAARIKEFRAMVQALNQAGLRAVMDVVYNHTNASGQSEKSVLDRIVPGYYHRLNLDGQVEKSTCCENTATEHEMMRKLMIDSVLTWVTAYKVDGFRFDLMGHHMLSDMQAVRAAVDGLTLEKDGVDGPSVYIYGEGWDFGEVANNRRGKNATQINVAGTGIGVFNDRLRDGVRGGSPFSDPREQGFATGLFLAGNAAEQRPAEDRQYRFFEYADWIRLGLAGNLAGYQLLRADGQTVPGRLIGYNGAPAGYTADPQENIVYVSAHDNETLFDAVQIKAPAEANLADRIRMNNLALSFVMFSQGVPFFHAGDDLLRSKSLDRNSYDSGDWFNRLDWTYAGNNWGAGLPIEGRDRWDVFRPILANPALKPTGADIEAAAAYFRELLRIRKSSPLFRLQTAQQVQASVSFLNVGPDQTPGLIVLRLADAHGVDSNYDQIAVLFNARPDAIRFADPVFAGAQLRLHPIQQDSVDAVTRQSTFDPAAGAFEVPGRTAAVFVSERPSAALTPPAEVTATPAPTPAPAEPAAPAEINWASWALGGLAGLAVLGGVMWAWRARRREGGQS